MEPSTKTTHVVAVREYIIKKFGPDALDKIYQQMKPQDKEIASKHVSGTLWYPERVAVNFLAAAEKVFGRGDYELCRQIGYDVAKMTIPKFYQVFIRLGEPKFILKNAERLWKQTHNHARFESAPTGPKSSVGRVIDFAFPHKAYCATMEGYTQAVLEMSGCKNVSTRRTKCVVDGDDCCEIESSWE